MLPLQLVLDLAKMWAQNLTLKKLLEYASSPTPDIQFDMPLVGAKVDIWIWTEPKCPPFAPKSRRGPKFSIGDKSFWLFYAVTKKR